MNPEHRQRIKSNLTSLIPLISFNQNLQQMLLSYRIFNKAMIDDILAEQNECAQKLKLLTDLCTRGPNAFRNFLTVLSLTGHNEAVQILDPMNEFSVPPNFINLGNVNRNRLNDLNAMGAGDSNMNVDNNVHPNIEGRGRGELSLRLGNTFFRPETHDCYEMTKIPRGFCFIINNVEFETMAMREGSDSDAEKLYTTFEQLHYRVILRRNLKAKEMDDKLRELARLEQHKEMQSLVVIILTHGRKNRIYGTDEKELKVEDILNYFDNAHCPNLIGKPKMFFIQACRGNKNDYGVVDKKHDTPDSNPMQGQDEPLEDELVHRPTFTDMIIAYSTVLGYVSIRNPQTGSWFCNALTAELLEHACDMDLSSILHRVDDQVQRHTAHSGEKQATEIVQRGVRKKVYFNPGFSL